MMKHWIRIERQYNDKDLVVGPYTTGSAANTAMEEAILIEALCQEDCLECFIDTRKPNFQNDDIVIIDPEDPDHTGVGTQSNENATMVILPYTIEKDDSNV